MVFRVTNHGLKLGIIELVMYGISLVTVILLISAILTDNVLIWKLLSSLGEEYFYVVFSLLVLVFIDADLGIILFYTIMLSGATNIILKNAFKMPRPPESLWRDSAEGYGFPSGHTQVATSFWSMLILTMRKRCLIVLGTIVTFSIALSRVALRVHYVTDVLGGFAVGLMITLIVYFLTKSWFKKSLIILGLLTSCLSLLSGVLFSLGVSYKIAGLSIGALLYIKYREDLKKINKEAFGRKCIVYIVTVAIIMSIILVAHIVVKVYHAPIYGYALFYAAIMPAFIVGVKKLL
ncbi:phosphatase PAP2 family protein [Desulfurococcaceae archaeon MEX13E-LK6-19]|nr:phosphatase PAP2 family protein [Desulfurococcaceae archaeon MEX13E-LK6-19]